MKQLVLAMLAGLVALSLTGCGTEVPDAKGMTLEQATAVLAKAGFEVGKVSYDEAATGAVAAVIGQKPAGSTRTKPETAVSLTIAGPPPVATPDLAGMNQDQVEAVLRTAGLTMREAERSWDSSTPVGILVSQEPTPDAQTLKGSAVAVCFSKGPRPVEVPAVEGKSFAAAREKLEADGFRVKKAVKASESKKDTVLTQKPSASKRVKPNSAVTLTISTGVPPRPSSAEVAAAIRRVLRQENPDASVGSISNIRIWRRGGRWWASGWAAPADPTMYEGANVILFKRSRVWELSDYGTGI